MNNQLINKIEVTEMPLAEADEAATLRRVLKDVVVTNKSPRLLMTYSKISEKGKKRVAEIDYKPKKGVTRDAVIGYVASVKLSKSGHVTVLIKDENRGTENASYGWTNIRLEGVKSVSVEG